MIVRLVSWVVLLSACYGVWVYARDWHAPWKSSPVLSSLPPMTDDCLKKDCLHKGGAK